MSTTTQSIFIKFTRCFRAALRAVGFAAVAGAATFGYAQNRGPGWVWQNPRPQGNELLSIHFTKDKRYGFAVGADNTILRTRDGGFSWDRQTSPLDLTLSSVFVKDKRNAVIVGTRGSIFVTDDAGDKWKQVASPARDHLYGVTFTGEESQIGWASGTYGRILKSADGG